MLETEALETGVWQAFDGWLTIFNDTLELTAAVPHAFKYVVDSVDTDKWAHINRILGMIAGQTYDACKNVIDREHETLHVLCLLASWGAFEAFIEEATKAALRAEPALLAKPEFARTTRKVAEKNLSPDDSREEIIDKVVNGQRGPLTEDGDGKYEDQLRLADLGDQVPRDLAKALMEAQQVRNVWAHNSGRADDVLMRQAPGLGVQIGDTVKVDLKMLGTYILAQNTYATIIINRFRSKHGLPAMECHGGVNMFKSSFDQLYPSALSAYELQKSVKAERRQK
ncbi:hypothetical protein [Mycolicibacterium helvum]|uniref:Uncharacterized protein n=1 Tax=Mycolicibacterium helvum TaxID=1534349 RepID=A0A7I7TEU6_9MYCO|nr:hypothetical protein [Mycolicibacterium helvum]BBY67747.1 hypothetical protein MHEL_59900 [Mycolicibacterium helvum]